MTVSSAPPAGVVVIKCHQLVVPIKHIAINAERELSVSEVDKHVHTRPATRLEMVHSRSQTWSLKASWASRLVAFGSLFSSAVTALPAAGAADVSPARHTVVAGAHLSGPR